MIKTGDWTIVDLLKYLVTVQQTLTKEEMDRLRLTSVFPKEVPAGSESIEQERMARHKAGDLYEPIDALRELKLPIIDWGTTAKWKASSQEGQHSILHMR